MRDEEFYKENITKELRIFEERNVLGKDFKMYGTPDEPLFLAKDVAEWIEHSDTSKMVKNIDDDEKLIRTLFLAGQNRDALVLTEDGLYEVLMQSHKPIAKEFKKQVKIILKSVRKNGMYIRDELLDNPDLLEDVIHKLKKEKQKRVEAENKLLEQQPKVEGFDKLINSNGLYNMKEVADVFGMCGRNTLMKALRNENVLSDNESNKNLPYSQYSKAGLFRVKVTPRRTSNGVEYVSTTLCTPKSFKLIQKVLDKNRDLLQK